MKNKKVLVLGASGGVGQWVVKHALSSGHRVRVVVRESTRYEAPEGIEVIRGDVLNKNTINNAVEGQDVVISALGIMREKGNNPWSKVVSPIDLTEKVTQHLIPAMKQNGINRIVAISAAGVAESFSDVSLMMKGFIRFSNINKTFQDFAKMEELLSESDLDALTVRPVGLVDDDVSKNTALINKFAMTSQVSKKDVAKWMVDAIDRSESYTQSSEMIGWK